MMIFVQAGLSSSESSAGRMRATTLSGDVTHRTTPICVWGMRIPYSLCRRDPGRAVAAVTGGARLDVLPVRSGQGLGIAAGNAIVLQRNRAGFTNPFVADFLQMDLDPRALDVGPINRQPNIGLIGPVRRAADVVHAWHRDLAALARQLHRMRDEPHVHRMILGESFDLAEDPTDVLGFDHVAGAGVLDLIVGINDEPVDAFANDRDAGHAEQPIDRRRIVLGADEAEVPSAPFVRPLHVVGGHTLPRRTIPERDSEVFFGDFLLVLGDRVFEAAHRESPVVAHRQIDRQRIDEFGFAVGWNAGNNGKLPRSDLHMRIETAPSCVERTLQSACFTLDEHLEVPQVKAPNWIELRGLDAFADYLWPVRQ